MAINNRLSGGIPAVAVVAGVLSGALLRTPGNAEAPNRTEAGATSESQPASVAVGPTASSLADVRPVIELLGQALGVTTSRNEVLRAARVLERSLDATDDATTRAVKVLRSKLDPQTGGSAAASTTEEAAQVIDGYLRSEVDPSARLHALQLKVADTFLDDAADERAVDLLKRAARNNEYNVQFLIATIPDYVDSNSAWRADQVLGAVQSAMGHAGYSLDRFRMIDWSRVNAKSEVQVATDSRLHEKQPGALIFRRGVTFQVVLLVLETPTGGIHRAAMINALKLVDRWDKSSRVKVIGPGFSGSTFSLARALKDWLKDSLEDSPKNPNEESSRIAIVSGSATADENSCIVERLLPRALYHTTVQTMYRALSALEATVTSLNPAWNDGANTALLIESNTTYGNDADRDRSEAATDPGGLAVAGLFARRKPASLPFQGAFVFRFPLHVAELRTDAQALPPPRCRSCLPRQCP